MKRLLAVLAFVLVAACSSSGTVSVKPSPKPITYCADLVAKAFFSTDGIKGDFECLSPSFQDSLRTKYGIKNDSDWARFAKQNVTDSVNVIICSSSFDKLDETYDGKWYEIDDNTIGTTNVLGLEFDNKTGLVNGELYIVDRTCP